MFFGHMTNVSQLYYLEGNKKTTVSSVCVNRTDMLDRVENNLLQQIIMLWKP